MNVILRQDLEGLARRSQTVEVAVTPDPEADLLRAATEVGNREAAAEWIEARIPSLGGLKPSEMVRGCVADRDRVHIVLGRIEHGIF